jgi:hypothetical protein
MRLYWFNMRNCRLGSLAFAVLAVSLAGIIASCSTDPVDAPTTPVTSPMPKEEFDFDQHIASLRHLFGNPVYRMTEFPDVDLVRVVTPQEHPEVWKSCMNTAGWNVVASEADGYGYSGSLPPDQVDAFTLADYTCMAQFPADDRLIKPWSDEQIRATFDYYVSVQVPCLTEQGFVIEPSPSWKTFRMSWLPDGQGGYVAGDTSWFPYGSVPAETLDPDRWDELQAKCPQLPSNDILWPEG